ncbi:enoyl-CoA hydratase/isomerase family protein [Beijerinckia indica]|uniref:Enoyl-CoA hydratase/isomerase n=1 Tax=Beijerinckia indica subsp. indica (strain ATCC 9039 / DSM 1715 / NCIMB 8712) TaxID=395963 RepID=B2IGS0_BEII9|nr:enoyl-CoA hydratase/isomerase family protein [Beijerinckia indica]ACB95831.1 Enoyl-CoA hydratase/isomerase [Beijerinckia indica subsp. indica ATCC 9039]
MNAPIANPGRVTLNVEGAIAYIVFDHQSARNAMTWAMYDDLATACAAIDADPSIRVAVLRGAGGKAFVAGTDIAQFQTFTGDDGVAYEAKVDRFIATLENLRVPTIAVVEGYAVGGGLAIANACDIRLSATGARFGVPIARTLGNCLSAANVRRLVAALGISWVKRMLLLAEMPTAEQLAAIGYLETVATPEQLDGEVTRLCNRLLEHAPLTIKASRETLRRLVQASDPDISDLIHACYGSEDFHRAVAAFGSKNKTDWQGR